MITRMSEDIVTREITRDDDHIEYAVGDVHGCHEELRQALEWCAEDASDKGARGRVHLLGDYIDRGPDSKGVIETLMAGSQDAHMKWVPIVGNHDEILTLAWRQPSNAVHAQLWWEHGGQQTLMSYGWNPIGRLPSHLGDWIDPSHIEFIEGLPHANITEDVLFVHAGIRPYVEIEDQALHDLLYIRSDFLRSNADHGRIVVHGHTPDKANPAVYDNRVALDSMCFASGNLSIAAFDPGTTHPRLKVVGKDPREIFPSPLLRA